MSCFVGYLACDIQVTAVRSVGKAYVILVPQQLRPPSSQLWRETRTAWPFLVSLLGFVHATCAELHIDVAVICCSLTARPCWVHLPVTWVLPLWPSTDFQRQGPQPRTQHDYAPGVPRTCLSCVILSMGPPNACNWLFSALVPTQRFILNMLYCVGRPGSHLTSG